jgi:hypothetical protein
VGKLPRFKGVPGGRHRRHEEESQRGGTQVHCCHGGRRRPASVSDVDRVRLIAHQRRRHGGWRESLSVHVGKIVERIDRPDGEVGV